MADVTIDVTNSDDADNIVVSTFSHNVGEGNIEREAATIVLEPGAGTSIVVTDLQVIAIRMEGTAELPLPLATAHRSDETSETVETPEE